MRGTRMDGELPDFCTKSRMARGDRRCVALPKSLGFQGTSMTTVSGYKSDYDATTRTACRI